MIFFLPPEWAKELAGAPRETAVEETIGRGRYAAPAGPVPGLTGLGDEERVSSAMFLPPVNWFLTFLTFRLVVPMIAGHYLHPIQGSNMLN
jgi:hypothetical protein